MISDILDKFEKRQKIKDEKKTLMNSLIGNCYQYKRTYNDKYFYFVRIIGINTVFLNDFIIDVFYKKEFSVVFERISERLENIQNMTKISLDEFEYNVSEYLKIMNLGFLPGGIN